MGILCNVIGLHKWGEWTPKMRYWDSSTEERTMQTQMVGYCSRCNEARVKVLPGWIWKCHS